MNFRCLVVSGCACVLGLSAAGAHDTNGVDRINQQLQQMQEDFQRQQRELRETFERMIREQQAQIEALKKQIVELSTNAPAAVAATNAPALGATNAAPAAASAEDVDELKHRVDELTTASKRVSVNQFNPGIGFVVDAIFSYTSRGTNAIGAGRAGGFDAFLRAAELNLEASVDPFAKAYGVVTASADARTGEALLGVEEASVMTTSLPWHLTAQGGRFFADFGRLSYIHDHDLPFVFRPLVLDRYIGGESRTDGAQVNYLFPLEHYISLTVGVGNGFGGDLEAANLSRYRSLSGLNYWGHLSTYFDLTPNLNLETGVSGLADQRASGSNVDDPTQRDRYVGGADITLRYQPLGSAIREGYVWGTEVLYNSARFDTLAGREESYGLYSYLEKKLGRQFSAGFLFDWMEEPADHQAETYRYSPYLTWHPSEFQFLRLQYSHTEPNRETGLRPSEAIYLQWSAIIGRHVHGFKQR